MQNNNYLKVRQMSKHKLAVLELKVESYKNHIFNSQVKPYTKFEGSREILKLSLALKMPLH